ncbi:hypothetical protein BCR42DRAFT_420687 [Absidia repens]|uniref:Uncharacterized protein n=1 Tax=Absidia repens TaxID=90262 RepID=A0A1X2I8N3_9FUNG|nr:hypothetical protein BCR42DRAFT_420687 [Absidia repens]
MIRSNIPYLHSLAFLLGTLFLIFGIFVLFLLTLFIQKHLVSFLFLFILFLHFFTSHPFFFLNQSGILVGCQIIYHSNCQIYIYM